QRIQLGFRFHLRVTDKGTQRCSQDDHGNGQNNECHGHRLFHRGHTSPCEDAINPALSPACSGAAGHRQRLPMDAPRCRFHFRKKSQQRLGVESAVCSARERGLIAGLLRQFRELPVKPPGKRAEPEDGAMQEREELSQSITTRNMRKLMRQDRFQLVLRPAAPPNGKQDDRPSNTNRRWHGKSSRFFQPRQVPEPYGMRTEGKEVQRRRGTAVLRLIFAREVAGGYILCGVGQLPAPPDSKREPRQKDDQAEQIYCERERTPAQAWG